MRAMGFYDKYLTVFRAHNIEVVEYSGIAPNPTLQDLFCGVDFAKKHNVDLIFALGGGSSIDMAKTIAAGIYGNLWDFVEKRAKIKEALPVVANATTSGTGSHVTPYAVITNKETTEKKTLKDNLLTPRLSLIDTDITRYAPPYIVATTGFDVLCHAVEVYTRNDCPESAEEFALEAIKLLGRHLINSFNRNSPEDIMGMAYADTFAGISLALHGTHVAHAISHPISALSPEISHGQALAYIMSLTTKIQIENGDAELKAKFQRISDLLGGNGNCYETIRNIVHNLSLDKRAANIEKATIEKIYADTMGYRRPSVDRSPSPISDEELQKIIFDSLG